MNRKKLKATKFNQANKRGYPEIRQGKFICIVRLSYKGV